MKLRLLRGLFGIVFLLVMFDSRAADNEPIREQLLRAALNASSTNESADVALLRAQTAASLGQHDDAERIAQEVLRVQPASADALLFLANSHIRADNLAEAKMLLETIIAVRKDVPAVYRRLGMVQHRLGDLEEARRSLERAVELDASDATSWFLLGSLFLDIKKPELALPRLKKGAELDPHSPNVLYALAQAQRALGDIEAASATLQRFKKEKSREQSEADLKNRSRNNEAEMKKAAATFHREMGKLLARQGNFDRAESHLREAQRHDPSDDAVLTMLATLLQQRGRIPEAKEIYQQLTQLRPADATLRANYGTMLLQLRETAAGIEQLRAALAIDPKLPEALANLTRVLLSSRQDSTQALELAQKLITVQPTAQNHDLLAWAKYANGDLPGARAAAAESVRLDPGNPMYQNRVNALNQAQ